MGFAANYVENDDMSYQQSVMVENEGVPGYYESEQTLAPSTVHRWITTLSHLATTAHKALDLVLQKNPSCSLCRDLAQLSIPRRKYKSPARKKRLLRCRRLLLTEAFFQAVFKTSIFTKLAIRCAFT
jgi:hypothetical protein